MSQPDRAAARLYATITLIGGSGRSGTTLLRRLLGRHPDVCDVPEWRVPVDPDGLVDFYVGVIAAWTPLSFDARYRALERLLDAAGPKGAGTALYRRLIHATGIVRLTSRNLDVAYGAVDASRFCPQYADLARDLLGALRALRYQSTWTGSPWFADGSTVLGGPFEKEQLASILGGFYRQVVGATLQAARAEHYLEKNTWYPLVFDSFAELVPDARLVCIVRDPRDVVCSMAEQRWAPSELTAAARYYRAIMDRWYSVRAHLPAGRFLEVRYEDLVSQPGDVLARVADFAGIPVAAGPYDVSIDSVGRWRRVLSASDLQQIAPYLAPELDA